MAEMTLTATGPVAGLLQRLSQAQIHDQRVEAEMARLKKLMGWSGVALGVGIALLVIGGIAFKHMPVPYGLLCVALAVGGIVGLIVNGIRRSRQARQNLENRRLSAPMRFLEVIGADIPAKANCSLTLSFEDYRKHGKLLDEEKGRSSGCPTSQMKYADEWLDTRGRLHDGNVFRLRVGQVIRRKEKRKPKYTKYVEQVVERIVLSLRISAETYPNWAQLAQSLQPATFENFVITRVAVNEGVLRVTALTPPLIRRGGRGVEQVLNPTALTSEDTLLRLFMVVYEKLRECRPAGAAGEPAASR